MKFSNMLNIHIVILLSLFLFGCGHNTYDDTATVTPTTQNLIGSYTLTDIAGTAWVQHQFTTLENPDVSVVGKLHLYEENFTYELIVTRLVGNLTESFFKEGTYRVDYTNEPFEGEMTLLGGGSFSHRTFYLEDNEIFFNDINSFLGSGTYRADETWKKVSDTPGDDIPNAPPLVTVTPTTESLVGSYTLTDIAGTAWVQHQLTTLEDTDVSVIGELNFVGSFFTYELIITRLDEPDVTTEFFWQGFYSVEYTDYPFEGEMTLSGGGTVSYRTFYLMNNEIMFNDISSFIDGGTYRADETWLKVNDRPYQPGS